MSKHNIFTHFPRDKDCEVCQRTIAHKTSLRPSSVPRGDALPEPKVFGDAITADHKILNEDEASRDEDKVACIIQDKATYFIGAYPSKSKSTRHTKKSFQRFLGPQQKAVSYTHLTLPTNREV